MRNTMKWLTFGVILTLLLAATGISVPAADAATWQEKVDPLVLSSSANEQAEFLVFLREQADLSGAAAIRDKTAKGTYVYETLTSVAETSQKPITVSLDTLGISYQPFWIANMLWVRGDINIVRQIAQRPDVGYIHANPQVKLSLPEPDATIDRVVPNATNTIEWNILKINADDVWAEGYSGQGAVIGGQDTGYQWDPPALINQYRGWNGTTASHDYNWFDATGLSPEEPADPHSHGTHTMGIMVGDDGGHHQVGVAPGARWIGCRNMDAKGVGTPATYSACYQWFVAPTRTDGSDPRPDLAPDVINNSWSCPDYEGCTEPDILFAVVQAVRAAGILSAHSAGNSGSGCETINEPAAIYAESFTVGSTTDSDQISYFSSRGPVTADGSNRFKPQVTAPGSSIFSTIPNSRYGTKSGTSMAAPHVAGLTALLISAQPAFAGQVDELETLIERSALPLYTDQNCGGDTSTSHPNHTYGWGRIDALAAYQAIPPGLLVNITAQKAILPGEVLTYTLTVTNGHPFLDTHNVILIDALPDETTFLSATGSYSVTGQLVIWKLGDLIPKGDNQVELAVQVSQISEGIITNEMYGAVSDEATTRTEGVPIHTIIQKPGVEISPRQSGVIVDPCNQDILQIYTHQITNTGNFTDTFNLSVNSSMGWTNTNKDPFTMASGESVILDIWITPPCPTPPGTTDNTTITVQSYADPSITETIIDQTIIGYRWFLPFVDSNY